MRHRVHGRKLGRTSAHRKALFRNQLTALFTHERIVTTLAKAKELRPLAERMVTLAGTGTLASRRRVLTMVPDKEIVRRLFDEIAPRFTDRPGGYTRILKMGRRRGDGAEMAIIEFVDFTPTRKGDGGSDEGSKSFMDRAKGLFGGGRRAGDDADAVEETAEAAADEAVEEEAAGAAEDEPVEAAAADDVEPTEEAEAAEAPADDDAEKADKKTD
jgi:large subunit ribosomal protein L17